MLPCAESSARRQRARGDDMACLSLSARRRWEKPARRRLKQLLCTISGLNHGWVRPGQSRLGSLEGQRVEFAAR